MPSVTGYTIENAIYTLLATTANVIALCPGRIYPDVSPQDNTFPFIVYTVISDLSNDHMAGNCGMNQARVQVDVYALTSETRAMVANQIKSTLDNRICTFCDPIQVDTMLLKENRRSMESPENDSDVAIYRSMLEFEVWYRDPVYADGSGHAPVQPPPDNIPRAYSYPTTLTFPTTGQTYTMFFTDSNDVLWICPAGGTTWEIINKVG